jgi:hypothetical protein
MKGLKDFYSRNEKLIFFILLAIAVVLGYKCYQKLEAKKEAEKKEATNVATQVAEQVATQVATNVATNVATEKVGETEVKKEYYRYITTAGEIANLNLERGTGGYSNIKLDEGSRARDPAYADVYRDIQNIGSSGFNQPGESKGLDYGQFTAYGGPSIGYY